jgi:hypothetical protein
MIGWSGRNDAARYAHEGDERTKYSCPIGFFHLPVPLEVVVRRNDGPGSRRMRLCQISYMHSIPKLRSGQFARAESDACAIGDCLFDARRCSTTPWYALSAASQCGAVQNGTDEALSRVKRHGPFASTHSPRHPKRSNNRADPGGTATLVDHSVDDVCDPSSVNSKARASTRIRWRSRTANEGISQLRRFRRALDHPPGRDGGGYVPVLKRSGR